MTEKALVLLTRGDSADPDAHHSKVPGQGQGHRNDGAFAGGIGDLPWGEKYFFIRKKLFNARKKILGRFFVYKKICY